MGRRQGGFCLALSWFFSTGLLAQSIEERTAEVRRKYAALYAAKVTTETDGSQRFHNGRLFKREGLNVLSLNGDRFEMAFQHGKLLKSEIVQGTLPAAADLVYNNVRNSIGNRPLVVNMATNFLYRKYTKPMIAYAYERTKGWGAMDDAIGIGEATGLGVNLIVKALFNPETLYVLAGKTIESGGEEVVIIPTAGSCSSFVAWDEYTSDGGLVIGRNTDFPLHGFFDRFPTVIYFNPTDGGQKYMTMVSAGVHNPGVVAYNEAGIYLASHTIPSKDATIEGVPVFMTAGEIVRQAKTMSDVVEYFQNYKPASGWSYQVVSVKERRVATIELSNQLVSVRESRAGMHVQTNQYMQEDMTERLQFINKSVDMDSISRYQRMFELVTAHKGRITPEVAMAVMGDHVDPVVGEVRGFPNTVSVHTTITSVVLEPEKGRLFVANGRAPVSETTYVELPTVENFNPETFASQPYVTKVNDTFKKEYPEKWQALQVFIRAKEAFEQRGDEAEALRLLKQSAALDSENPAYHFEVGIFALLRSDYNLAERAFKKMLTTPCNTHQKNLGSYYLGRVLAARGQLRAAEPLLKLVAQTDTAGKKLNNAAQVALDWVLSRRRAYPIKRSALHIMMQQADTMGYE